MYLLLISSFLQSQGQTLDEVIIDFSSPRAKIFLGSFYVALTRVRNGSSFYLTDFKLEYIQANPDIERKLLSMTTFSSYNFKKIYLDENIFDGKTETIKELKVGYINTNDLLTSSSDVFINTNANLSYLDLLCVADTRLLLGNKSKEDLEKSLHNWKILRRFDSDDGDDHMGLLLLQSKNSKLQMNDYEIDSKDGWKSDNGKAKVYIQIMRVSVTMCNLKLGFIYINSTPIQDELEKIIFSFRNCDLIMGDLNLDPKRDEPKLRQLCGSKKVLALKEFTFRNFNQLDHIILNKELTENSFSTSYRNPTSDHRIIAVRLPVNSHLSESFKQDMNFDKDHWTKMKKKPYSDNSPSKVEFTKDIVNAYIEMMKQVYSKAYILYTDFIEDLLENNFVNLDSSYKVYDIIEASSVLVPLYYNDGKTSFKGLLIWRKENLSFYDPQSNLSAKDIDEDNNLAKWFQKEFIDNLYRSFALSPPKLTIDVFDVEGNKLDENQHWVYLLSLAKHHIFGLHFDFTNCNLTEVHQKMSRELKSMKIFPLLRKVPKIPVKRQLSNEEDRTDPLFSKRMKPASRQHIFSNLDQDSCWMNSCLQSMLAVLEHTDNVSYSRSTFMELLQWYKGMDSKTPINPQEIKELLYSRERQRIIERKVRPQQRLFHFANTTSTNATELDFQLNRRGQQDCKDFFVCIGENKEHWLDIHQLFKFSLDCYTVCSSCNQISRPDSSAHDDHSIFLMNCPSSPKKLSNMIVQSLNEPTLVEGWKHQEGCEQVTIGYNYTNVLDLAEMKFFIVIVERLIPLDDGTLQIVKSKIEIDEVISFSDSQNREATFKAIAVIHHTGHVNKSTRDTSGHYRADILDADTDQWYQTSDDDLPFPIKQPSDQGYIIILKNMNVST